MHCQLGPHVVLQVTPHSDEETFPAGLHPLQEAGMSGLKEWTDQVLPGCLP